LTLTTLDPAVGTPGRCCTSQAPYKWPGRLRKVSVALRLSRTPVNSRNELAVVATSLTTGKDGPEIASEQVADVLPPGSSGTSTSPPT
jgi:hypothetical protein